VCRKGVSVQPDSLVLLGLGIGGLLTMWLIWSSVDDAEEDIKAIDKTFDRLEYYLPVQNTWSETTITSTYKKPKKKFPRKPRYMKRREKC
jgi:hypothetical protein